MRKWVQAIDDFSAWLRVRGYSPGTIALRRYHLRRLAEEHLRRSPWRITSDDLIRWMAGYEWEPATRQTYVSTLRTFYQWAQQAGRIKRDPTTMLPSVRMPRRVPKPTPDDVWSSAMLRASDRDRLIIALGSYAGLRRGEIASLRWEHIEAKHLRITGKGRHTRLVPIHDELRAELDRERNRRKVGEYGTGHRYRPDDDSGYVFPGRGRAHLRPDTVGRAASRLLGPGWAGHSTRHRFGTRAYAGSLDLGAVQDLMGHATPAVTRGYTHVSDEALRAAVASI